MLDTERFEELMACIRNLEQQNTALEAEVDRLHGVMDLIRLNATSAVQEARDVIPEELLPSRQLAAAQEREAGLLDLAAVWLKEQSERISGWAVLTPQDIGAAAALLGASENIKQALDAGAGAGKDDHPPV